MTTIAFTGHRPKDLPEGFGYSTFAALLTMRAPLEDQPAFVTGGALGVDTYAAEYAVQNHIPLHIILPFPAAVMSKMWRTVDILRLNDHIDRATSVTLITTGGYDITAYQKRNEAMVDRADLVVAVWTGKPFGGTANCVKYAERVGKRVINLL